MRTRKALINTIAGLSYEGVAIICAMILPRLILSHFGSSYNGITTSISQFISCVALLKAGIAGVTKAALYKPLADKDTVQVSKVVNATDRFMRKIALIFLAFLVIFSFIYPVWVRDEFEWLFSASLVLIIGFSTFMQYYFGFTYQALLHADQRQGVTSVVQIISTVLNVVLAYVLIKLNVGIHMVKLGSTIVFALNPLIINAYARKKYNIVKNIQPDNSAISQRWDAFAHEIANFINSNIDIILLTIFMNMKEVSVYSVYYLIINGLRRLLKNAIPSVASAFGDMMAKGENKLMDKNFRIYELVVYSISLVVFLTTGFSIVSFILIYTEGVNDVSYQRPLFAILISLAAFFSSIRLPYQHVVEAAGHYKQTKKGAFLETVLNTVISIVGVLCIGLVGVAIGTLVAAIFRTFQYAIYLSRNIIKRELGVFIKHIVVAIGIAFVTIIICIWIPTEGIYNYFSWCIYAFYIFLISCISTILFDYAFFRMELSALINKIVKSLISCKTFK